MSWKARGTSNGLVSGGASTRWRQTLRQDHAESFRPVRVRCRNGDTKHFWVFTKVVRLKRYGRKRLVIVHEAGRADGRTALFGHRCAALGKRASHCHLELSLGLRNLSRVQQAGDRVGSGSGAQGGSGQTPLSIELRSAVADPAGIGFRRRNGKVCVCQGRNDLWPEVSDDSAGRPAWAPAICRPAFEARALLWRDLRDVDASIERSGFSINKSARSQQEEQSRETKS